MVGSLWMNKNFAVSDLKIMISVGEASGDMHAANVLQKLKNTSIKNVEAFGMGGKRLHACGMELLVDNQHHSVMGLVEVLNKYPQLRANLTTLKKALRERQPDLLLVVDYPHFNMKLAAAAKSLGIPVIYFIAPKVWASRPGRLQELTKLVDHMAVILPFEVDLFEEAGIPTTFVGNPLLDNSKLIEVANNKVEFNPAPQIALLLGSRKSEISYLFPAMLDAAALLKDKYPDSEFLVPVAETIDESYLEEFLQDRDVKITLIKPDDYQLLSRCKVAIVASGTATLELAVLGVPMIVTYKMNQLSYAVVKRWVTIPNISLTNIIAKRKVVPELLQDEVTAEALCNEADQLLTDKSLHDRQKAELATVYKLLGSSGATDKLTKLINHVVAETRTTPESKRPAAQN